MCYNSSHSLHTSTSTFKCFILLLYIPLCIPVCSLPTHHGIDKPRFLVWFFWFLFIHWLVLFLCCFLYFLLICKIGTTMTLRHSSHWEAKLGDCTVCSLLEKQTIPLPGTAAFDHLFTCFSNPFKRLPWRTELLQGKLYKARELTCKKRKAASKTVHTPDSPTLHAVSPVNRWMYFVFIHSKAICVTSVTDTLRKWRKADYLLSLALQTKQFCLVSLFSGNLLSFNIFMFL